MKTQPKKAPKKPIKTAEEIAAACEAEAKKLLSLADILRGKG